MKILQAFSGSDRLLATSLGRPNALLVLPLLATLISVSFAQSQQIVQSDKGSAMSVQVDNEAKGKALRKAIDQRYESLNHANAIKPMGKGQNNIDDVVLRFIPIGTSFKDAEQVLEAAGFTLSKPGNQPPFQNYFAVRGTIDQYVSTPFGKTSVVIDLQPNDAKDWSFVHAIGAVILRQYI